MTYKTELDRIVTIYTNTGTDKEDQEFKEAVVTYFKTIIDKHKQPTGYGYTVSVDKLIEELEQ